MEEVSTQVFRLRDGVAIELPVALGYPAGTEVVVSRDGDVVTIKPKEKISPAEFIRRMKELGPPLVPEVREPIEFPERPGL